METPALEVSDELAGGLALYASGLYWDAHEAWESLWRRDRASEWAACVQGLIQVAAAFHKLYVKREPTSASRILARALPRLERYPADYLGLELGRFVSALRSVAPRIAAMPEGAVAEPGLAPELTRTASFRSRSPVDPLR